MKDMITLPFPYVHLDFELNIDESNSLYKTWVKDLEKYENIRDLMPEYSIDNEKQRALIGDKYYELYTTKDKTGYNVIFVENPYINNAGQVASNILVGLLMLDNYTEIQEDMDEIRLPHFMAIIERKITDYFNNYGGLLRKFEKDKFLFVLNKDMLPVLKENKFSIAEQIAKIEMGNTTPATLSIGIGMNGKTVNEDMAFARGALDLALGRGGNQIVIKEDEERYSFLGGDGSEVSKNSKVRARVKAYGLVELILSASDVIVMGHKNPDLDSLGSAAGIFAISRFYDKKCHIVLNRVTSSVKSLYDRLCSDGRYEDVFIDNETAQSMLRRRTLLIVVDTHRAALTECPELIERTKKLVMFDHHRKCADAIENCSLTYHESYASSTSEMVTEMLMYIKGIRLTRTEIEGLLAGITLDTKNFAFKTGIKTFEAAAYLKKNGADTMSVRRLFKNSIGEYLARSDTVRSAEVIYGNMALSVLHQEVDNPVLLIAQTADELLNLEGIEASFVLCESDGAVNISARSLGKINVQKLMEKLGGGGHQAGAAAQLQNVTIAEAIETLKETIEQYIEENN